MKILGIETSCDETAAAVVEDGVTILSNVVASQEQLHARFGGIVPEVASRQHLLTMVPVVQEALARAGVGWDDLAAVAVTHGPGLAGSLLVGVSMAKSLAFSRRLPLVPVNHLEGHIYANWLASPVPEFPLVCLIVSGGHTGLFLMEGHGQYKSLGQTRDDAAGEAFDKVARLLGLGFPGGPAIQRIAQGVEARGYALPRAWLRGTDDFSFSGLKTAVLRLVKGQENAGSFTPEDSKDMARMAASFQEAVVDVLVTKTLETAQREGAREVLLGGGVAANLLLRDEMAARSPIPVRVAPPHLCTDNAAMIAACGYFRFREGHTAGWDLDVHPSLKLT
ncbi:MAG: metal-dependent protease [Dehalococcoidia bacterium]|nr:metal-dependent protease [Dehalococcoidia bacterium]